MTASPIRRWALAAGGAALLALGGCVTRNAPPPPSSTRFSGTSATLNAILTDNFLIVEAKGDRNGPFHFLVDTGSSVTLVAPDFAQRHALSPLGVLNGPGAMRVEVRSADGGQALLPAVTLSQIDLAGVRFTAVPAVIQDMSTLSADLGVRIDAILGFPFFHDAVLTLDYLHRTVKLQPAAAAPPLPGTAVPFDDSDKTPVIVVQLGDGSFRARIDSGIDEALALNPAGLDPKFEFGPVTGRIQYTVAGSGIQRIGRLAGTLTVAGYPIPRPVAELTNGTSALGGGLLRNFEVTFDQLRGEVAFFRDDPEPIAIPGRRSPGMSFDKTPAYWRVVGVIPGSPAANAGVEPGDLVTQINGKPVSDWDLVRYDEMVANAEQVSFTFLHGTREVEMRLRVMDLVP